MQKFCLRKIQPDPDACTAPCHTPLVSVVCLYFQPTELCISKLMHIVLSSFRFKTRDGSQLSDGVAQIGRQILAWLVKARERVMYRDGARGKEI